MIRVSRGAVYGRYRENTQLEELLRNHWDQLWNQACRLCNGNIHDAGDLLSDGLVEAFRYFDRYSGPSFDCWFFGILRFNRLDMARNRVRHPTLSIEQGHTVGNPMEFADIAWDPEDRLFHDVFSERVESALGTLSPDLRKALLLCDVEQMEYQEIAAALGLPIGTVRSRIHRARSRFRDRFRSSS